MSASEWGGRVEKKTSVTRGVRLCAAILVLGVLFGACSSGGGDGAEAGGADSEEAGRATSSEGERFQSDADRAVSLQGGGGGSGGINFNQPDTTFGADPKVIKNGEVTLEVPRREFGDSIEEIQQLAVRLGGVLQATSIDDAGDRHGTVVIRVPSASFERALGLLDEIGDVRSEFVDTQDVTEEFVDLRARVRNARAQQTVLLRLMDRATSVGDTIRVQNELAQVQESIERMKGRLRVLGDLTSFSTLAVEVTEKGVVPQPRDKVSTLARAWDDAIDAFLGVIAAVIVGAGFLIPVALLALAGLLVFRRAKTA